MPSTRLKRTKSDDIGFHFIIVRNNVIDEVVCLHKVIYTHDFVAG